MFKNLDKDYYLEEGEQTQLTDVVYEHAEKVKKVVMNNPETAELSKLLLTINKTCKYICHFPCIEGFIDNARTKKELYSNKDLKDSIFRKRTLEQVLKGGQFPTCSDKGLLFRWLMTAQGYPTAHLETFHEEYLFDEDFHGHVFARVFDKDKSIIVDPRAKPVIANKEEDIFPYVIFREWLDSWDVGHDYEDMHRLKKENIANLLERYEFNLKKDFEKRKQKLKELRKNYI